MPQFDSHDRTRHRFEIIDPSALEEERDYCLTCGKFDDGTRKSDPDA